MEHYRQRSLLGAVVTAALACWPAWPLLLPPAGACEASQCMGDSCEEDCCPAADRGTDPYCPNCEGADFACLASRDQLALGQNPALAATYNNFASAGQVSYDTVGSKSLFAEFHYRVCCYALISHTLLSCLGQTVPRRRRGSASTSRRRGPRIRARASALEAGSWGPIASCSAWA